MKQILLILNSLLRVNSTGENIGEMKRNGDLRIIDTILPSCTIYYCYTVESALLYKVISVGSRF